MLQQGPQAGAAGRLLLQLVLAEQVWLHARFFAPRTAAVRFVVAFWQHVLAQLLLHDAWQSI